MTRKLHLNIWTLLLSFISVEIAAQSVEFKRLLDHPPLDYKVDFLTTGNGQSQFIDLDQDGDSDVYISNGASYYENDGAGNFHQIELKGVDRLFVGAVAFADFNGDGLLDFVQSGIDSNNQRQTQVYRMDSLYHFSRMDSNDFLGVALSYIATADVDGDADHDFIIVGQDTNSIGRSRMYLNQGNFRFTLSTKFTPPDVFEGSLNFIDIDSDNDQDLLFTGNNRGTRITKFYKNDGLGGFTEDVSIVLEQVYAGRTHFFDADNDTDLDLVITGDNNSNQRIAKLYLNNGSGNFVLSNNNFVGSFDGRIASAHIDNDNLLDLIITGFDAAEAREKTNIYINLGNGLFQKKSTHQLPAMARGGIDFADVNNDGESDLLMTGDARWNPAISSLFLKDSIGNFTEIVGSPIEDIWTAGHAFLDLDNDSDLDLFINGNTKNRVTKFDYYENDGSGQFKLKSNSTFNHIRSATMFPGDFNEDGFRDVLISGEDTNRNAITQLFINDTNGHLIPSNQPSFDSIWVTNLLFFDRDMDGLKDLFLVGRDFNSTLYGNFYNGNTNGIFGAPEAAGVDAFSNGDMDFGDVDNDGDFDLITVGNGPSSGSIRTTQLYLNDGTGQFTKKSSPMVDVTLADVELLDIENDGDVDVFLTGMDGSSKRHSKLYLNDGWVNFTLFEDFNFKTLIAGDFSFWDMDGDGYKDLLHNGVSNLGALNCNIYLQTNALEFVQVSNESVDAYSRNSMTVEDFDGDGLKDLFVSGFDEFQKNSNRFYLNRTCQVSLSTDSISACYPVKWINDSTYATSNFLERYRLPNAAQNGCDSIVELKLTISTMSDSVLQNGDTLMAFDSLSAYQWINCSKGNRIVPGATKREFIIPDNNSYAVVLSKSDCADTSFCISLVGIKESPLTNTKLTVGPVPTKDFLNIKLIGLNEPTAIQLVDLNGRIVRQSWTDSSMTMDISELRPGVYFIRAGNLIEKIVKQ